MIMAKMKTILQVLLLLSLAAVGSVVGSSSVPLNSHGVVQEHHHHHADGSIIMMNKFEMKDQDDLTHHDDGNNEVHLILKEEENEFQDYEEVQQLQQRQLQDSTTTNTTFWQRIKESLGLVVIGLLLICIMPCLIWKNEGRHVTTLSQIDYCKNQAVEVNCIDPTDETVGSLVHFTGAVQVGDSQLNVPSAGLKLEKPIGRALLVKRTCYIYQKFEVQSGTQDKIGGGQERTFQVKEDWTFVGPQAPQLQYNTNHTNSRGIWDSLVTAASDGAPPQPQGQPENPMEDMAAKMGIMTNPNKPPHALTVSPSAHVGAFHVSSDVVLENLQEFSGEGGMVPVPAEYLPYYVEGCDGLKKGSDNVLRTYLEGEEPQNGDCKVVFEYLADGFDSSFVVKQTKLSPGAGAAAVITTGGGEDVEAGVEKPADAAGNFGMEKDHALGRCKHDLGEIWMVRKGVHNLEDMVDMAKTQENQTMKIMRILCFIGLFAGWCMLFAPFITVLAVLPILAKLGNFAVALVGFIVALTCCCTITLLAYLRYRPVITGSLLAVALGIWGIIAWRLSVAADAQTPAPTPAPTFAPK